MGVVGVSWDLLGLFKGRLWVSWGPVGGLMTPLGGLLGWIGGVLGASSPSSRMLESLAQAEQIALPTFEILTF